MDPTPEAPRDPHRETETERTRLGFGHRSRKKRLRAAAVAAIVHVACVLTTGAWIFFVVRACVRA